MLPPIEPEIATANPKFDALYRDLCSNKLNVDGSTKVDVNAQKERDVLSEDLQQARVAAAKAGLIRTHLQALAYDGDELPVELRELVAIITATLSAQLSPEDTNLLRPDVETFKGNISPITRAISNSMFQDLTTLSRIISPESSNSSNNRDILLEVRRTKTSVSDSATSLSALRLDLAHESVNLLSLYRTATELSIRILEQTIHGSICRSTKTKAEYLATVAEGMSRKLQLQSNQLMAATKSPEMEAALAGKAEKLEMESGLLKRKVREARGLLEEYRDGGGVEGLAREYARILGEAERVRGDIERLEGGSGRGQNVLPERHQ